MKDMMNLQKLFATTLNGKLLEFALCSNLSADAKRKAALNRIVDSIKFVPEN